MARFSELNKSADIQGGISSPSEICNVDGCKEKTIVQLVSVSYNGKKRTGVFSEFGKKIGDKYSLNEGIIFRGWITRCARCYQRDIDRRLKK